MVFDDSVFVILDIADILADNYNHYKINLPEGSHNIKASYEDYSLIDTTIIFTSNVRQIELIVDMKNAVHLSEFKDGFNKIYTNKNYEPIIGLREDGSFLLKSFFHISIVGCFQFESGKYKIEENKLILDVDNYRSRCFRSAQKIEHTYEYTIENDSIVDLNKYSGFIEKNMCGGRANH